MTRLMIPAFAALLVLAACSDPTANYTKATTSDARAVESNTAEGDQTLKFSNADSKLEFIGAKVSTEHPGGFDKFEGALVLGSDGAVKSVDVTIDVSTLWAGEKGKGKEGTIERLTGHLKSADFFEVEKWPTARFVTTEIKDGGVSVTAEDGTTSLQGTHTVTANLTMRDTTRSVTFPATIGVSDSAVNARAEFSINRNDWGIVYKGMADDLIRDNVVIRFDINAAR